MQMDPIFNCSIGINVWLAKSYLCFVCPIWQSCCGNLAISKTINTGNYKNESLYTL